MVVRDFFHRVSNKNRAKRVKQNVLPFPIDKAFVDLKNPQNHCSFSRKIVKHAKISPKTAGKLQQQTKEMYYLTTYEGVVATRKCSPHFKVSPSEVQEDFSLGKLHCFHDFRCFIGRVAEE